jgi:acyl-CoA thioester hydrolase
MTSIPVRWRDLDPLGHVNSAVFITFFETGRDIWLREVIGESFSPADYVLARIEVDFRADVPKGTEYVETAHTVETVGRSSITLNERILDPSGAVCAEARAVIVLWDPQLHASRQVRDLERDALLAPAITAAARFR